MNVERWLKTGVKLAHLSAVLLGITACGPEVLNRSEQGSPTQEEATQEEQRTAALAGPNFQAPFPCGQTWTYSHHSAEVRRALDFVNTVSNSTNGQPILASAPGYATRHYEAGGAGNYIKIDHGGGWWTYYFHLSSYSVPSGVNVAQGQEIGKTGSTGASSGPHIHYEQLLNGVGQDIVINGVSLTPYPGSYFQKSIKSNNCPAPPGLNPAHNHPAAASMAAGTQQVYIRGPGNSLWVKGWNGSVWGSWLDLGGLLTSAPSATSPAPNVTHVYVRGTDNQLYVKGFANNTWGNWLPLGGILTSGPSAVSPNQNVTWVFIRAQDNRLWVKGWTNNTWGEWVQIGGDFTFASDPSAVSMSPGTAQVYVRGHDNALWVLGFDGTQWGTWLNLGGSLTSAPAAVSASPNTTYVYARGTDNAIHVKGFSNNTWGSWLSLGGTMTSSPAAVSDTLNTNHIYARGTDNAVWVKGWVNNTWGEWVSIGGTMPD